MVQVGGLTFLMMLMGVESVGLRMELFRNFTTSFVVPSGDIALAL